MLDYQLKQQTAEKENVVILINWDLRKQLKNEYETIKWQWFIGWNV